MKCTGRQQNEVGETYLRIDCQVRKIVEMEIYDQYQEPHERIETSFHMRNPLMELYK